jgi:DNA adenine methylase
MIGPLAYIGGKRRVAPRLAKLIPEHIAYVEPFSGGAQVFFHKLKSPVEVLNDLDGEVYNFLRVCQLHHPELVRVLRYWIASRRWFDELLSQDVGSLTDVQRAARFLFLQRNAFGGRVRSPTFHYAVTRPQSFNPRRIPQVIAAAADRLAGVQLENWPYERVLERYDRPSTFFFIDPPYVGISAYRFNFEHSDFESLAARLRGVRGRFLMTLNDCEIARTVFAGFHVSEHRFVYTSTRKVPTATELLISNYPLPAPSLSDSPLIEDSPGS